MSEYVCDNLQHRISKSPQTRNNMSQQDPTQAAVESTEFQCTHYIPHQKSLKSFYNIKFTESYNLKALKGEAIKFEVDDSEEIDESLDATVTIIAPIFETQTRLALSLATKTPISTSACCYDVLQPTNFSFAEQPRIAASLHALSIHNKDLNWKCQEFALRLRLQICRLHTTYKSLLSSLAVKRKELDKELKTLFETRQLVASINAFKNEQDEFDSERSALKSALLAALATEDQDEWDLLENKVHAINSRNKDHIALIRELQAQIHRSRVEQCINHDHDAMRYCVKKIRAHDAWALQKLGNLFDKRKAYTALVKAMDGPIVNYQKNEAKFKKMLKL